ncbi:MAG TPA: alpha/beta hydrolase, partial [Acidobacteriota bacterium]|nr:alpha/beta hydrolase [Acidobacteriota bacterium]
DATLAICKGWPKGQIPADFHEPVQSDLPVLLIAGEYDPASPLELAEKAARHLPNGALVRVVNRSHWGLRGNRCIRRLVSTFLDKASVDDLDLSCASQFKRPPFELGK